MACPTLAVAPSCQNYPGAGIAFQAATPIAGANGPTGTTFAIEITVPTNDDGSLGGLPVNFAGEPATITVSPATVATSDDGRATTYALVPYGVEGIVVASGVNAVSQSIPVSNPILTLCPTAKQSSDIGPTGVIYDVTVGAYATHAGCQPTPPATDAVPGVAITLTTIQTSGSGASTSGSGATAGASDAGAAASPSTATIVTGPNGLAKAEVTIPWGSDVQLQATGGGGVNWYAITGVANPLALPVACWMTPPPQLQTVPPIVGQIYTVEVTVTQSVSSDAGTPAVPVNFAVIFPGGGGVTVSPASALTNNDGTATSYVTVLDAGALPNGTFPVVEATVGNPSASVATTFSVGNMETLCP